MLPAESGLPNSVSNPNRAANAYSNVEIWRGEVIFEVTPEHIEVLSDSDLRTLVGYLAEQEAIRFGYSPSSVTCGGHQSAKDGGVDVRVEYAPPAAPRLIIAGRSSPPGHISCRIAVAGISWALT
jgi:hypothetical protein